MRLLLFLSALLTGLTGLLPGTGAVGARQVAQAQAVAGAVVAVAVVRAARPHAIPSQPLVAESPRVFLTPAPFVDVRTRIDSARE